MTASQSQHLGEQATVGQLLQRLCHERACREANIAVQDAAAALEDAKYKRTISCLSCQSQAGTASTASLLDSIAAQTKCRFFADHVTAPRPKKRTDSEENTRNSSQEETPVKKDLKGRLRNLLDSDRKRATAREIELRSQELGDDAFVFEREALTLAEMDPDKLRQFFEDVLTIKGNVATEYYMATKHLIGEDE